MTGSFTRKRIRVTFRLGLGPAASLGHKDVILEGLRSGVQIVMYAGTAMGEAHIRIWGPPASIMNEVSAVMPAEVMARYDIVTIEAGDDESGMAVVFNGGLSAAWTDFSAAPDAFLACSAYTALFQAIRPTPAVSYPGPVAAAQVFEDIAETAGWIFENGGVTTILPSSYFSGGLMDQLEACARAARCEYTIDQNTLAVVPKGRSRETDEIEISAETGMVGYPSYTGGTLRVATLFDPRIKALANVKIKSVQRPACGTWRVNRVVHELSSEMPGGPWFTRIEASKIDFTIQPRRME